MIKSIGSKYNLIEVLYQTEKAITYYALDTDNQMYAVTEFMPEEYRDGRRSLADTRFTAGYQQFAKDCTKLSNTRTGRSIIKMALFLNENGTAYIVSEPIHGISLQKCIGAHPLDPGNAAALLAFLRKDLSDAYYDGISYPIINDSNVFICEGAFKLLHFGEVSIPRDYNIKDLTDKLYMKATAGETYNAAPGIPPSPAHINGHKQQSVKKQDSGFAILMTAIILVVSGFIALSRVADELYEKSGVDYTAALEGDGYIEEIFDISQTYAVKDIYDPAIVLNGTAIEYDGQIFYRTNEDGIWKLYRENADGSGRVLLLENYAPAFMQIADGNLYFVDCLDNYYMYILQLDSASTDVYYEWPTAYTLLTGDGRGLITLDLYDYFDIMYLDTETYDYRFLFNDAAGEIIFYNDLLYFVNLDDNSALYSIDPYADTDEYSDTQAKLNHCIGFNLVAHDGGIYYLNLNEDESEDGKLHELFRYDIASGRSGLIIGGETELYQFDIHEDYIYYIDAKNNYNIYRCELDGKNPELLIDEDVTHLSIVNNQIYYFSEQNEDESGVLMRSGLDGENKVKLGGKNE